MGLITGNRSKYSLDLDLLKGTTNDDIFIMGEGSEYAIGNAGVDTAQISYPLSAVYSAMYDEAGTAIITFKDSYYTGGLQFYYFDSIEIFEFADQTINLAAYKNIKELSYISDSSVVSGQYSIYSTSQDLLQTPSGNKYTLFLPGSGSASIIGTISNFEAVFIESKSSDINFQSNGQKATISIKDGTYNSIIVCRDIETIYCFDSIWDYDKNTGNWLKSIGTTIENASKSSTPITNPVPVIKNTGTAGFSISGKGDVGSQLSIIKTKDDPEGNGKFTYKWQSSVDGTNWTNLAATSSSYTIAATDASKQLRASISYLDGKSNSESVDTSALLISAVATTKLTAGDFATPVNINLSLPAYVMSTNWNIDKYYYYVEQYPMTLRTAFYADYLAGRYTNQALYGQNHYLTGGQAEGRSLPGTDGILPDSNDYGAYVENYGITLLDIYRVDSRAVVNGGTMSLFAWGKEHYTNWGKAEGREISGGVEWGGIVRNNLDLYNQWQDARIVNPTLSAFAFGYQRQNTIKSTLGVLVGSDTADKLTGQIAYGLNGNDVICSDGGRGILAGGFGDDLLVAANGGSDLAYGGPGSDIFQLNAGSSFNIRDFRKGADMIQLGSTLTSSGVTMQWDSADNSTLFYNGSSVIGKVYGKRPTEFTYSDSTNGVSKVYI